MGQKTAEEFYSLSVKAVEEVVTRYSSNQDDEVNVYWARPSGSYDICTKGLSLGAAMHKVARQILKDNDAYVLIGTDTPQISKKTFNSTLSLLKENKMKIIFGPSRDGGFYLMAGTYTPNQKIMESVSYSQEDTLEQLLLLLKTNGEEWFLIEELSDVDVVDDLKFLHSDLVNKEVNNDDFLPSQKSMLEWLIKRNLA
jgi:hypothetical protein